VTIDNHDVGILLDVTINVGFHIDFFLNWGAIKKIYKPLIHMNNSSTTHNSILENEKISPLPRNFLFFETSLLVGYHEPRRRKGGKGDEIRQCLRNKMCPKKQPLGSRLGGPLFQEHTLLWCLLQHKTLVNKLP